MNVSFMNYEKLVMLYGHYFTYDTETRQYVETTPKRRCRRVQNEGM